MVSTAPNPKWKEKMDITYEEYFNAPIYIPHKGIILLTKILEDALGKEEAHRRIQKKVEEIYRDATHRSRANKPVEGFKDFQSRWANISTPLMQRVLEAEILESTLKVHRMRVHKCLFAETFRSMGESELGYIWECNNDSVMAEESDPRVRMVRTKTLMQGDDCCWTWKEDE